VGGGKEMGKRKKKKTVQAKDRKDGEVISII
jgi:hypothetical protein